MVLVTEEEQEGGDVIVRVWKGSFGVRIEAEDAETGATASAFETRRDREDVARRRALRKLEDKAAEARRGREQGSFDLDASSGEGGRGGGLEPLDDFPHVD